MSQFSEGDRIRIVSRQVTDEDLKSNLYFSHYGGLLGTVQKVYSEGAEVAIDLELSSLTKDVRDRHEDVQQTTSSAPFHHLPGRSPRWDAATQEPNLLQIQRMAVPANGSLSLCAFFILRCGC